MRFKNDCFNVHRFNAALLGMREGKVHSTREFLEAYVPYIGHVVEQLHYMVRSMDVDDLVQETLIALLTSKDVCRSNVKGWLYKFAYWRLRDCNARDYAKKRGGRNEPVAYDLIESCLADEREPSRTVSDQEAVDFIFAHVGELDRRILTSIKLGFSRVETARHLGISERTVRRHLASMRTLLEARSLPD